LLGCPTPTFHGPLQHDSDGDHDFDCLPTVTTANGTTLQTSTIITTPKDPTT
jgi:hypothetical protein